MLPISFMTDYGHDDEFVGVCHGVIQRIAPGAVIVDITHAVPRHDARAGALRASRDTPTTELGSVVATRDWSTAPRARQAGVCPRTKRSTTS